MIKRNMVKAGDILHWQGGDEHFLMLERTCKNEKFIIWRALNMANGQIEGIEMNRYNASNWRKVA